MKFQKLFKEQISYKLNDKGQRLVQAYHKLIEDLTKQYDILDQYINNPQTFKPELAVLTIGIINSQKVGNELFNTMVRLDAMTNGGKSNVSDSFTFNENDTLLNYLEKIE